MKRERRKGNLFRIYKDSIRLFLRSVRSIIVFEVFFKLAAYFILFPLFSKIESLVLRASGVTYITMQNVQTVLLNPLTWLVLIVDILLIFFFTSVEMLGLFRAIHAAASGVHLHASQIFHEGIRCTYDAVHSRSLLYPIFVMLLIPSTNIIAASTLTQHLSMPGFIMSWIEERPAINIAFTVLTIVLAILALLLMYAPSAMTAQSLPFEKACKQSMAFSKGHRIRTMLSLAFWLVFLFLTLFILILVILGVIMLIGFWLDPASFHLSESLFDLLLNIVVLVLSCMLTWVSTPIAFIRLHAGYLLEAEKQNMPVKPFVSSPPFAKQKILNRALIIAVLILGFFFIPPRYRLIRFTMMNSNHPIMVMGHRGDSVNAPENTIAAFESAYNNGADAIELDVQMTRDGELIILHDSSLTRTTGLRANVWEVDWDDIRDLDNGSFFSPEFSYVRIPTLDEVIKFARAHDNLYMNIEIKRTGHDEGIEEKVINCILDNEYADYCDITSLDYATLETVRSINPAIRTVYTTVVGLGDVRDLEAADIFSLESVSATGDFVEYLNKLGKGVFVWTLNTESELEYMIDLGVDALLTDNVALARSLVDENVAEFGTLYRIRRMFKRL